MHASNSLTTENIISKTTKLAHEIKNKNSSVDDATQLMENLGPLIKNTFNKSFKNTVSSLNNSTQKQMSKLQERESSEVILKANSTI